MEQWEEVSAINMVYGAAASGIRAMTSSSSPGVSLKQEGISYMVDDGIGTDLCAAGTAYAGINVLADGGAIPFFIRCLRQRQNLLRTVKNAQLASFAPLSIKFKVNSHKNTS